MSGFIEPVHADADLACNGPGRGTEPPQVDVKETHRSRGDACMLAGVAANMEMTRPVAAAWDARDVREEDRHRCAARARAGASAYSQPAFLKRQYK
jgi:hypothetical protein